MLYFALLFFVISVISALLGFGGLSSAAAGVAKVFFYIFLVAFAVTLLAGVIR